MLGPNHPDHTNDFQLTHQIRQPALRPWYKNRINQIKRRSSERPDLSHHAELRNSRDVARAIRARATPAKVATERLVWVVVIVILTVSCLVSLSPLGVVCSPHSLRRLSYTVCIRGGIGQSYEQGRRKPLQHQPGFS